MSTLTPARKFENACIGFRNFCRVRQAGSPSGLCPPFRGSPANGRCRWTEGYGGKCAFATRVRQIGHGRRHRAQPVAPGDGRGARFGARETLPGRQRWNPAATGAGRIDGVAKVTGSKLYASDFRAADMPGWPAKTSHALLIRAADATHVYDGLDLSRLSGALRPSVVVTADDLVRIGTRVPEFYAGDLLCPVGKTPLYLGQPIALLIFEEFDAFDQARLALRDARVRQIRRGDRSRREAAVRGLSLYPGGRPHPGFARYLLAGPERLGQPANLKDTEQPIWTRLADPAGQAYAEAAGHGEAIRAELAANNPAHLVLERQFETQSVDPMFLEPECGIAWYDPDRKNLELVLGVQSPYEAASRSRSCSARPRRPSDRRASTRNRLMSAADSAAATTRRFRSTSRLRRCSFPAARSGSRTIASSNSNPGSSGTPSRCTRGWASTARPAR